MPVAAERARSRKMSKMLVTKHLCSSCTVLQNKHRSLISKTSSSMTNTLKFERSFTNNWNIQNIEYVCWDLFFILLVFKACVLWEAGRYLLHFTTRICESKVWIQIPPALVIQKQEFQGIFIGETLSRVSVGLTRPQNTFIPDQTHAQTLWKYILQGLSGKDLGALKDAVFRHHLK